MEASSDRVTNRQAAEGARPVSARRPRWGLWAAAAALVLVVAVAVGHGAILRALAEALIVQREEGFPDAVWLVSGDHRFQTAAELYFEDPRRVILVGRRFPDRLVELGILPRLEEVARARLEQRGVPASAVELFGESCRDTWESGRALRAWMQAHPDSQVLVVCERFRSRQLLATLRQVLGPEEMARIGIRALRDYRYDETDWWKVRSGVKQFVAAWLGLGCVWAFGEPSPRPPVWSAEEYEAQIARCVGGASR